MELGGKYLCLSDIFLSSFSRLAGRWLPLVELVETEEGRHPPLRCFVNPGNRCMHNGPVAEAREGSKKAVKN